MHPASLAPLVKTLRGRHPGLAVREAVGQLLEYRHFLGPQGAELCILLDAEPTPDVVAYVGHELGMLIVWWCGVSLSAGPRSRERLPMA